MIMNEVKTANSKRDIHKLIRRRYSPYVFDFEREVPREDIAALFEAASWAANSYNEQPWRYIVATRDDREAFETMLSCLNEGNRGWAKHAPVLALGVYKTTFSHNDKPNGVALHDLGAASAGLTLEATARGLLVHQMAGIVPEKARDVYNVPEGFEVATGIAIGYPGDLDDADEKMRERDSKPRSRKPLNQFVFAGTWEKPAM
jgi:nitroreductase